MFLFLEGVYALLPDAHRVHKLEWHLVAGSLRSCEHVLHMYVIIGGGGRLRLAAERRRKAKEEKDEMDRLKKQAKLDRQAILSATAAASTDLHSGLNGFIYMARQIRICLPISGMKGQRPFKYITRSASSDGLCDTTPLTLSTFTKGSDLEVSLERAGEIARMCEWNAGEQ